MIAKHFHFGRDDFLAMGFDELVGVWLPEVLAAQQEEGP